MYRIRGLRLGWGSGIAVFGGACEVRSGVGVQHVIAMYLGTQVGK